MGPRTGTFTTFSVNSYCKTALLKGYANLKPPNGTWEYVDWVLLRQQNAERRPLLGSWYGFTDLLGPAHYRTQFPYLYMKELGLASPCGLSSSSMPLVCDSSGLASKALIDSKSLLTYLNSPVGTVVKDGEKPVKVQSQIPKHQSRGLKNSLGTGLVIMSEFVPNGYPGWGGVAMCPCCTLGFCLLARKCLSPLWNNYFDGIMELEEALGSSNTVDFKLCSCSPVLGQVSSSCQE